MKSEYPVEVFTLNAVNVILCASVVQIDSCEEEVFAGRDFLIKWTQVSNLLTACIENVKLMYDFKKKEERTGFHTGGGWGGALRLPSVSLL